jgi:small subunit ribosomal protein S21
MRDKVYLPQGIVVEVQHGDLEKALRKLKKKVQNEGVFQEIKKREHFTKPSEKKRRAKGQAIARQRKRQRIEEQIGKEIKLEN